MAAMREYKMVLLGAGGVGKSALTVQFVQGIFVSKYDPTIEESYRKLVEVDNVTCMLEILDTAGTESFTAMRDLYMKTGQGFILIYSIVAEASFVDLQTTYDHICRVKESNEVPTILVGNKCDLQTQRVIQPEQGKELAAKWKNSIFIEASAKTRVNVDEIFTELIRLINKVYPPPTPKKKKGLCSIL